MKTNKANNYLSEKVGLLLLILLAITVWCFNYALNFGGFNVGTSDAMSYSNMATSFLEGRGFSLNISFPLEISLMEKDPLIPFVSSRYPYLHPLYLATFFKIFGINSFSQVLATGTAYIFIAIVVYFLAKKLFGYKVAIVSTMFVIFDSNTLVSSISGISEPLFTVFFLLTIYFLCGHINKRTIIMAGVCFGLAQSVRLVGLVYIVPFIMFILFKEKKIASENALLFFIFFVIASLPVYIQNYINYGSAMGATPPYYLLNNLAEQFQHHQPLKILANDVDPVNYVLTHKMVAISKYINVLIPLLQRFFNGTIIPLPFFYAALISLFLLGRKPGIRSLQIFIMLLLCAQIAVNCIMVSVDRYFIPFIPLLIIFSVALLFEIAARFEGRKFAKPTLIASTTIIFLLLFPFKPWEAKFAAAKESRQVMSSWSQKLGTFIQENTERDEVIVSDVPWLTGWYGKRPSLWLPASPEIFDEMDKEFIKVDYLFLSANYTLQWWEHKHWQSLYKSPRNWNGFVPYKIFKYSTYQAILYKRETS